MKKSKFKELVWMWSDDLKQITRWFYSNYGKNILRDDYDQIYEMMQTVWTKHRKIFRNKGHYKMVRRLFVKNLAVFLSPRQELWQRMSSSLCKEILHKYDQGWISETEISDVFKEYLVWCGSKAGYLKRKISRPCFVDKNLREVFSPFCSAGIVNFDPDPHHQVEILFFDPLILGGIVEACESFCDIENWRKRKYPNNYADLPNITTCQLANVFLKALKFNNCFAFMEKLCVLDEDGTISEYTPESKTKNLFVSVFMTLDEFRAINPNSAPEIYLKL